MTFIGLVSFHFTILFIDHNVYRFGEFKILFPYFLIIMLLYHCRELPSWTKSSTCETFYWFGNVGSGDDEAYFLHCYFCWWWEVRQDQNCSLQRFQKDGLLDGRHSRVHFCSLCWQWVHCSRLRTWKHIGHWNCI